MADKSKDDAVNVDIDTSPGLPAVPPSKVQAFTKARGQAKVLENIAPGVVKVDLDGSEILAIAPVNMPAPEVGTKIDLEADKSGEVIVRYLWKPQPAKAV